MASQEDLRSIMPSPSLDAVQEFIRVGPSLQSRNPRSSHWPRALFGLAAVTSTLFYAISTGQIWEDFFITFRHSVNLVEGRGLVYQPGERIHGFTSPLGVLLPALCYELTGEQSYERAVWAFRVPCIIAYVIAGLLVLGRIGRECGRSLSWWAMAVFLVLDVKSIAFSVNGMETAFVLFFIASTMSLVSREPISWRWVALGISWGGLMWARPDGCVLILAGVLAEFAFGPMELRDKWRDVTRAAGLGAAIYLPWFLWAWTYYGSPLPHTIVAKMNLPASLEPGAGGIGHYFLTARQAFLPIYYNLGNGQGWHPMFRVWSFGLGLFAALYWLVPVADRCGRSFSLLFAVTVFYLSQLSFSFPWYLPPATLFGLATIAIGLPRLVKPLSRLRWLAPIALSVVAVGLGLIYAMTVFEMRVHARVVDRGNRARVGRWLADHVLPGDRVYVECVGYIGYFSGAAMADWPGLVSPEVVWLAREHNTDFYTTFGALRPEWAVLRPWEAEEMVKRIPAFSRNYELLEVFDVNPIIYSHATPSVLRPFLDKAHLPGIGYLTYDAKFYVFRRHEPGPDESL